MAKVLETVLSRRVDPETVAFAPQAANASNYSTEALTAAWSPVVEAILSFLVTQLNPADFSKRFSEDGYLEAVAKPVSAYLYAAKTHIALKDFVALVSDS